MLYNIKQIIVVIVYNAFQGGWHCFKYHYNETVPRRAAPAGSGPPPAQHPLLLPPCCLLSGESPPNGAHLWNSLGISPVLWAILFVRVY
jgi:hypothetical protein